MSQIINSRQEARQFLVLRGFRRILVLYSSEMYVCGQAFVMIGANSFEYYYGMPTFGGKSAKPLWSCKYE